MRTVLFVFTGGTISMRRDPRSGVALPALSGSEVLQYVPEMAAICQAEVVEFGRFPGPHITPERMWALSDLLNERLAQPHIAGAVVTHGTDTLEETAYLLDLRLGSPKPVVVTGALRNSSETGWDGPSNLLCSARAAVDEGAQGRGVLVVLHETIHGAAEATKTHTHALDSFQSLQGGPLGVVDCDRVVWWRCAQKRVPPLLGPPETRVDLLAAGAGTDGRLVRCSYESGARGLVLEGTGRGNVPPMMVEAVQEALDAGVAVVLASRCQAGRVLDTYGYDGSGRDLRQRGVLLAGTLSAAKARIRLMALLGLYSAAELRSLWAPDEAALHSVLAPDGADSLA